MKRDKEPEDVQAVESNRVRIIWTILGQEQMDPGEDIDLRTVGFRSYKVNDMV